MKLFNVQYNVGKTKYLVNYHDGLKKHGDGSPFFDIHLTNNKRNLAAFTKNLVSAGYTRR